MCNHLSVCCADAGTFFMCNQLSVCCADVFLSVCNHLSVCCADEGGTVAGESAQVLTVKNRTLDLHLLCSGVEPWPPDLQFSRTANRPGTPRRSCKCYFTLAEFKMAPTCSGKTHMRFTLSSRWYPEFKMVPTRSRKTHMRSTLSSRWYPEFKMVPTRSRKPTRAPPHLVSPEQALKQFECWSVTGYGPFSSSQERSSIASCFTSPARDRWCDALGYVWYSYTELPHATTFTVCRGLKHQVTD